MLEKKKTSTKRKLYLNAYEKCEEKQIWWNDYPSIIFSHSSSMNLNKSLFFIDSFFCFKKNDKILIDNDTLYKKKIQKKSLAL